MAVLNDRANMGIMFVYVLAGARHPKKLDGMEVH